MEQKTIMICLEKLGIGGVETAVYNQAYTLKNQGYNVIVVGKPGIYKQKLESYDIKCIDFEFELENNFNFKKAEMLEKIMLQNNVCEVHINQFPCILSVFIACIKLKIPYVAYIHVGLLTQKDNVYDWFEKTFSIYKIAFKLFFKNAYKIIAITDYAAEYNAQRYKIDKEKYLVINNSINFELYNKEKIENLEKSENIDKDKTKYLNDEKIENFLIISRISNEKLSSIKNAIDFYISYCDKANVNDARLDILGDGDKLVDVKKYIDKVNVKKYNINFLGQSNSVAKYIEKADVVLAIGRCILETIVLKKLSIIASYSGSITIVKPDNVSVASKNNFDGKNFENKSYDLVINELKNLTSNSIKDIVKKNYDYAFNNLNSEKNIYVINKDYKSKQNIESYSSRIDYRFFDFIFDYIKLNQENAKLIDDLKKQNFDLNEKIKQQNIDNQNLRLQINELSSKNVLLSKELKDLYNSKRWRYASKIAKIFGK